MIQVLAEGERLTVQGHAGYAPGKEDIVCAAVSALLLALAETLQEKNLVRELLMKPGFMTIWTRSAQRELTLVLCGLRQLERKYPQCVQVVERESLPEGERIGS